MISTRDIFKIVLNLVVVYAAGGLLLDIVYVKTSPVIFQNAINQKKAALHSIMPEAGTIDKLGEWEIHERRADYFSAKTESSVIGYVIESYGKGYSGYIQMLIATDTLFRVVRISILSHAETPGLGDGIESEWFKKQFSGKGAAQMRVSKSNEQNCIQAISGATISSRAVTEDAVKKAVEFLAKTVGRNKLS